MGCNVPWCYLEKQHKQLTLDASLHLYLHCACPVILRFLTALLPEEAMVVVRYLTTCMSLMQAYDRAVLRMKGDDAVTNFPASLYGNQNGAAPSASLQPADAACTISLPGIATLLNACNFKQCVFRNGTA